jgi:predicted LPLAT superfamily acyltransferase
MISFFKKYRKKNNDTLAWEGKSRGGAWGHRFFIFLINHLGIRFAYFFLSFVILHFIPFAPIATKSVWKYYREIQGFGFFKTIQMLYLNYYRFGQVLIDRIAVRSGQAQKYHYEFENYPAFLEMLNGSKGVILIGAHVGNWEIGSGFFGEYAPKINIVMLDAEYRKIKKLLEKNLNPVTHKIIPIQENDFKHIYQIKDALDRGEYVCFQGDRFIKDQSTTTVQFLGKPAKFSYSLFQLAVRFDVPVVFYFSMREKGMKYKFKFIIAKKEKDGKSGTNAGELMDSYIHALENMLKEYPEQWFNYYDFWNV